ncbi:MAG: GreA/GreB family elongation factor [Verrucomicrobiota bacterium]
MSKAFTREDDSVVEPSVALRPPAPLPNGAKNYLTPQGEQSLRAELARLIEVERPATASLSDKVEATRELQRLDQRIYHLQTSLETAVVVPPPAPPYDRVLFGATVSVRDHTGEESRYRIVGVDETDLDRDEVSWLSPIAKTLLNARLGQKVKFRFPAGEDELEIISISY